MMMIQDMELDVERMSPCLPTSFELERTTPPLVPLVRVDSGRRGEYDIGVSRLRDERDEVDVGIYGRKFGDFGMNSDHAERSLGFRVYRATSPVKFRQMERNSGQGELIMMPEGQVRFFRDVRGDLVVDDWKHGEMWRDEGCSPFPNPGARFEQDRERGRSPFRMPGSGFEQDRDGVFRCYENSKKVVLGSQRNADWERRGVQQHNHTPRKKLTPKKSVLLRMQPSNNSFRNRIDNNSGASQERVREDREGSPVELDVTFKSNALVAKAVKTPLASVVVCDKGSHKVIESKVMSSEVSGSISHLVVVNESTAKINSDVDCGSESYTPIKDREHSEEITRHSSSLKELNHVASNCRKSPSTSQSVSVKETSRSSPQVVASDKEGVTVHHKASSSSSRKKRKITRPPSSGLQVKVEDLTNVGTLLSSLPGDSLSNNHVKIHEDLTSFAKFTDNDAGLCASAMVVDGLVDDTISERLSLMNRKGKQSIVKDLRDSFTGAIGNEGVADPSGSVDGIPFISDSDESFKKSPDNSSSSVGNDEANDNSNSLDPNLLRIGCGDGSSEFLLPDMVHFDDCTLDSLNNMIQEVQPCADSSMCVSKNGPVVDFQEKICFNGTLAASTLSIELSKEHLPVASDSKKHSELKFSVEDGNVSSEIGGKQMHAPSEIGISEVSSAGNFVVADWSNSKDIKICEGQSSAEACSLRADVALCSAVSAADSKESTTELNVLGTIHKHTLGETFVVSSSARPAEGSLESSVHIEDHICSGIGNDSDSIKKRNADADVTLMGSMTDNVETGSITDASTTFSCTVEAEQPGEDRSTGYRCSIDSSPCSNEPHSWHDFRLTDSFMAQSAVSAFNSDFMVAFPPCKKQKFLLQHVCSSETLLELHGTPVSSELPVVDKLVLSHPACDSVELVVVKQASGSVPAFECNSAGLTELPEKSAVCRTSITFPSVTDEFNDKLLESDPSSFDPCAIVKQASLADDRSPCLSESGICNNRDKQGLMDSANHKNQITDAVILGALPDENGLDDGDVKNQHNHDLQVELLNKDSKCGLLAKDAAEPQNYSPVEDEPPLSNCSEVHTEPTHRDVMAISSSKIDALSDVVNQESRCTLNPELPTTITAVAVNSSSNLKLSTSHQDFNGKSLVGGGPPMSMSRAFTRTSNIKLKSGGVVAGSGHSGNPSSFSSQAAQKAWPVSNSTSREQYEGENALNYHGRKFGSRRPFIATPSSKTTSTSYNMKPRTWHRTDESASSNVSVKATSLNTIPPRKTSFKKSVNIQGNTYIRKGTNSIVRTPAAAAVHGTCGLNAIPDRSNPTTILNARSDGSSISESLLDDASNRLCTEGDCSLLEMPKTPPLPCSNNSSNRNVLSWDECRTSTSADASVAAEIEVVKPSVEVLKTSQPEVSLDENMKDLYVGSDGYLDSGNKNKLVYKKGKPNQLVAASAAASKQPFSSSTCYFKRSINQLVRASSKSHIQSTVTSCKAMSKHRKSSLVWTLHDSTSLSNKGRNLLHCRKLLPNLLPWKRPTWRRSLFPSAYLTTANSIPVLRRKLLSSRKRDVIYTRSGRGFTLRRSKVVCVGRRSLKWSKSIEKLSKKANKAATLAVAEMDGKKREKIHMVAGAKKENQSRDRIFRIGMFRYRMDHSGRTLQRISDEEPTSSAAGSTAKHGRKPYVPKRLLVGNDEYVQVGNGNQLIRDPKRRIRILASEKVKWSLHTARMRLVKKKKYCLFFTRFGKCNKVEGKCPYIHDASKIAVCTKYLNRICFDPDCTLTHQVIPERMPDCSFFLQGMCSNRSCPYRHVNVNPKAGICENFLKGYCVDGNECRKKHSYICPAFEATGSCPDEPKCKLYHPRKGKVNKRRSSEDPKNSKGRYFGLGDASILEPGSFFPWKLIAPKGDDIFLSEGRYVEYISLDVSDEVGEDDEDSVDEQIKSENELSCASLQDLDELIKPVRILRKSRPTELASASTSSG